ncbi:hypothetical protein [Parapedobacter tibetensis]|uniref:hypothetical protein n=1 Tax=Parapedobacter tibetensis TaxID=2972951 RepID=UPI00214D275C|nr:hypothetical protein [Parapedobacter tibetensis]
MRTIRLFCPVALVLAACLSNESKKHTIAAEGEVAGIEKKRDSIYVKFDTTSAPENRGGISLFHAHNNQRIIGQLTGYKVYPFESRSAFMLLAFPNEAIYLVMSGDSVIVSYDDDYYPRVRVLEAGLFK